MDFMMKTESWDYDHFSVLLPITFDESPHISIGASTTVRVLGGKPAGGSETQHSSGKDFRLNSSYTKALNGSHGKRLQIQVSAKRVQIHPWHWRTGWLRSHSESQAQHSALPQTCASDSSHISLAWRQKSQCTSHFVPQFPEPSSTSVMAQLLSPVTLGCCKFYA